MLSHENATHNSEGIGHISYTSLLKMLCPIAMKPAVANANYDEAALENLGRATLQIVHDLKNQLNGLKLYATDLRKQLEREDRSAEERETLAKLIAGLDRAAKDLETRAKAIDAILARNNDQATAFGFRGTPSFIIGKFRVPGALTMAQFDQDIADARKAAAKK